MLRAFVLRTLVCCASVFVCGAAQLIAAEVDSDVSTRETYVGLPIVLRIHINNAVEHETPVMPEVDGLKIEPAGPPSESRQIISVNGRRTQRSTVTYAFRVTPLREGTFTIPPVKVVADGLASITKAVRVVATRSETDDLLFVEIEGSETEVFVGEAIDLTLKIWLRPYRDRQFQLELDDGDMWQCLAKESTWGPFQQRLEELAGNRQRPAGRRTLREDSSGNEREYFVYEIDTTVYPDRPTNIDGQDVRIIVNYPVELGRSRSPFSLLDDDDFFGGSLLDDRFFQSFGSRLTITRSRPIVAEANLEPILVKPVPTQGRPGDYVGAVGRYSIAAEATPTSVQVGDPITLHLYVEGTGSMDVVRAPPLVLQQNLIRNFKVPDEPLAGAVNGSVKQFTTTIRPLREDVTEIPPIEYTYFDPDAEQFVTAKSQPIPINVQEADVLALDAIVGARGRGVNRDAAESVRSESPADTSSLFSAPDLLANVPRARLLSPALWAAVITPPAMFLAVLAFSLRWWPGTWISASRRLHAALRRAESGSDVAAAMERFLATRFQLAPGRLIRDQTIGALRGHGRHDLAIRVERIYHGEDRVAPEVLEERKREAAAIAGEVNRKAWSFGTKPDTSRLGSTTTALAAIMVSGFAFVGQIATAASIELTPQQQSTLAAEAVESYRSGLDNPDKVEAVEQFRGAADQFQLLVDSGLQNDRLYFNLAEAAHRAGRVGTAIANYRRALRLVPDSVLYRDRLQQAEQQAGVATVAGDGWLARLRSVNANLQRWIAPSSLLVAAVIAWAIFWLLLSLRVLKRLDRWKAASGLALAFACICGGAYYLGVAEFTRDDLAVLTSPSVVVRQGDGESFEQVKTLDNEEGRLVRVLARRGNWIHVHTGDQEGWIKAEDGAQI